MGTTGLTGAPTGHGVVRGHRTDGFLVGWRSVSSDARVASVRIRCLNPLRELRRRGYPVELFDPGRRSAYSVVIYSKVYGRSVQTEAMHLRSKGTRVILDLCDNHFYNPLNLAVLQTAAVHLREMIGQADELVASTPAMAEVLQAETGDGKPVTVIGDAVETRIEGVPSTMWARWWARRRLRGLVARLAGEPGRTRLVWFGAHGGPSGAHGLGDLESVRPMLEDLHRQYPLSLTVISNSPGKFARWIKPWRLPTYYLEWNAETFLDALRLHTIAVIPIQENPFTRCKTNNRLTTAFAAGLAVVATGIPSYKPFEHCCALDDWSRGFRRYIADPEVRRRAVAEGQALVHRQWTLGRIADHWQEYFESLRQRCLRS